jgi:integral membrane protein
MTTLFRYIALLEGISYLVLFSNMLFIKPFHLDLYKTLLFPIGMSHGLLFIAYVYLGFAIREKQQWSWKDMGWIQLASLLPFGTFIMEKKYL